jgi:hypothetical protein
LAEKAYSKLHGCYQSLSHGNLCQALNDLTGEMVHRINIPDNKEAIWQ